MYDIIIIGAGPSGMSAALYALRAGKKVLLLEKESVGGQIATSPRLENYPSIKEISGLDFANNLFDQILDLGVEFELEEVLSIIKEDNIFKVQTNYNLHLGRSVVIATGVTHRKIGVSNEDDFVGKGLSYCAVCDGPFYKDEEVVIVGDANTALQYTLLLTNYCKKVTLCTLFDKFFADNILVERLKDKNNLIIYHNLSLIKINGEKEVESVVFADTKTSQEMTFKCKAIFIAIGQIPNNNMFLPLVDLNKGFIITNEKMETKTQGLYAAGDCRFKEVKQVVTATNDGAIAATNAIKYLEGI